MDKPSPTIDTLVEDIYALFGDGTNSLPVDLIQTTSDEIAHILSHRLSEATKEREPTLRMSNLGRGDRQIWYELHAKRLGLDYEKLSPVVLIKFMFGDVWESLILSLAEAAGHKVEYRQTEVEVDGIKGHNDAIIDGVVVDVKTCSKYAFRKFEDGTLADNDPFGYMEQLSGYCLGHGGLNGAFLAVEKERGKLCLLKYDYETQLKPYNIPDRIAHLKEVAASDTPPDRCYAPEEEGKSGNLVLGVNCSYCPFKATCWSDSNDGLGLRTFLYSTGPKSFVHVEKEPRVPEITF